jgi:hypothetical protein
MAGPEVFPVDVPLPPERTVGWVMLASEDEPLSLWLHAGAAHFWEDARSAGKEPGQPVLFLQTGRGPPCWMGWGRVLEPLERWRVYGVRTVCAELLKPPLPVVDPTVGLESVSDAGDLWENRALGAALGLLRYRDRTPYGEVGARDLRLTDADLHQLVRAQPGLRRLGSSSSPIPLPTVPSLDRPSPVVSHRPRTL